MRKTIVSLSILFLVGCGCVQNYSEGERIGVVTKISHKGFMFKSWEGSALIALPAANGTIQPEQFDFNVDESAVQAIQDAAASGKRVKLIYRQWMIGPASIDNDHVVYQVQPI